jgi:plasmid stability protein
VVVNLSIKNVPEALAEKLRGRAARNHRSLQGELMAILEAAANEAHLARAASSPSIPYQATPATPPSATLLDRMLAIVGDRGIEAGKRMTREQAHDRVRLRKSGR